MSVDLFLLNILLSKKRFWICRYVASIEYRNLVILLSPPILLTHSSYEICDIGSSFSFFTFIPSHRIFIHRLSHLRELGNDRDHENHTVLSRITRGLWMSSADALKEEGNRSFAIGESERACKHFSTWHVYVTLMVNRATGKRQFILQPIENFLSSSELDRRVNGRWCTFCLSFTPRVPCTWMTLHCGPIDRSKGDGVVASSVVLSPPRRAAA